MPLDGIRVMGSMSRVSDQLNAQGQLDPVLGGHGVDVGGGRRETKQTTDHQS